MAATEGKLGQLHARIADVFIELMDGEELPGYEDPETGEVIEAKRIPPSAAILAAATKFLKDNDITADRDKSDALGDLEAKMAARRANRQAKVVDLDAAREQAQFMLSK